MDFIPAHQALREDWLRSRWNWTGLMIDWDKGHFTGCRAFWPRRTRRLGAGGAGHPGNVSAEGSIPTDKRVEAGMITAAACLRR